MPHIVAWYLDRHEHLSLLCHKSDWVRITERPSTFTTTANGCIDQIEIDKLHLRSKAPELEVP